MKVVVLTRDWKGGYECMGNAKGMMLYGGEDEIETGQDSYAMLFVDQKPDKSPQELYDIWEEAHYEDCEGVEWLDDDTIEIKNKKGGK